MFQKVLSSKAEKYNITEVVGLPGAGKSTLVEAMLAQDKALVAVRFSSRSEQRWYSFLYGVFHPISFCILLTVFVCEAPTHSLRRYTLHLLLVSCARYQKAMWLVRQRKVIIDEGLWQRVITLSTLDISKHHFVRWCVLFALPKKIKIVFIEGGDFSRFRSDQNVQINTRLTNQRYELQTWIAIAKHNVVYLDSVVAKHVPTLRIDQSCTFSERVRIASSFL